MVVRATLEIVIGTPQGRRIGRPTERAGLRRVDWVRVTVEPTQVSATVVGVGHRRVVEQPLTLRTAAELADAGVPIVMRRLDGVHPFERTEA